MVRVRRAAKKGGGVRKKNRGAEKRGVRRTPLFSKRGVHAAQAPPLYTLLSVRKDMMKSFISKVKKKNLAIKNIYVHTK